MPNATLRAGPQLLEWRLGRSASTDAAVDFAPQLLEDAAAPAGATGPPELDPHGAEWAGALYRDEAIVLRTHKLGEADRIITLLTRQHGRVRAVAKGVRRTTSRFGSRLEPFTHVDLQLAEGRSLDTITQAETLTRSTRGLGLDYDRYTAGTVMLETAERLVAEERQPAVQQFLLLVGGLRAMVGGEHAAGPGARLLPAALAGRRRLRAVVRPLRALRRRGAAPLVQPLGRRRAVRDLPGCPGRPARRRRPSACSARCSPATGRSSTPPSRATSSEASSLVAAYLAWHLERGLRSLAYVER